MHTKTFSTVFKNGFNPRLLWCVPLIILIFLVNGKKGEREKAMGVRKQ